MRAHNAAERVPGGVGVLSRAQSPGRMWARGRDDTWEKEEMKGWTEKLLDFPFFIQLNG